MAIYGVCDLPARLTAALTATASTTTGPTTTATTTAAATTRSRATTATATKSFATRRTRTCFVHGNGTTTHLRLIQLLGSANRLFFGGHLDEAETPGPARGHVAHDLYGLDLTDARKEFLQLGFCNLEWKIAYEQLATH